MLVSLTIRNYALIQNLNFRPTRGLNIITGETGAGKSIMLGAMGLLMGNRADTKVLFSDTEKCVVEGTFSVAEYGLQGFFEEEGLDYEDETIIRREITPQGKSRAFVNDTPVTLDQLRELTGRLIDIHSQHDTLQLGSQAYQLSLVDGFAGLSAEAASVGSAFGRYRKLQKRFEELTARIAAAAREKEFNQFQSDELEKASLKPGEVEALEQELELLENTEDIRLKLGLAAGLLEGGEQSALDALKASAQNLEKVATFSTSLGDLSARLQSAWLEVKDIASELSPLAEQMESDPARLEEVNLRLSQINLLLKKHGLKTSDELIELQNTLSEAISGLDNLDEEAATLEKEARAAHIEAMEIAKQLSQKRRKAIQPLEQAIGAILLEVGMPNARLSVEHRETELSGTGIDSVRVLFSANKGIAPQELKNAASGGEFSRLMLAVKHVLAGKTSLPTLVFDEIDTGISGEIAMKVGRLMRQMAQNHQLMVITHMPQIAARGGKHFFIYKKDDGPRTFTQVRELEGEDRLMEIAQMIGGERPSQTAVSSARELIEMA